MVWIAAVSNVLFLVKKKKVRAWKVTVNAHQLVTQKNLIFFISIYIPV